MHNGWNLHHKRTLGVIILPDGRNLNQELVRARLAWHYKKYSKDTVLDRLEKKVRSAKRGLWQDPNSVAPWDWRKKRR